MQTSDFEEERPTQVIPRETMIEARANGSRARVVCNYGEGHAPIGPDRPTRDLRLPAPAALCDEDFGGDTDVEDHSDGIPVLVDERATARTLPVTKVA